MTNDKTANGLRMGAISKKSLGLPDAEGVFGKVATIGEIEASKGKDPTPLPETTEEALVALMAKMPKAEFDEFCKFSGLLHEEKRVLEESVKHYRKVNGES